MVNVVDALEDAIETLEQARQDQDTDTGTGLLLDARIRGLRDCKDTVESINDDEE